MFKHTHFLLVALVTKSRIAVRKREGRKQLSVGSDGSTSDEEGMEKEASNDELSSSMSVGTMTETELCYGHFDGVRMNSRQREPDTDVDAKQYHNEKETRHSRDHHQRRAVAQERDSYRQHEQSLQPEEAMDQNRVQHEEDENWMPSSSDWNDLFTAIDRGQHCALYDLKKKLDQLNTLCIKSSNETSFRMPVSVSSSTDGGCDSSSSEQEDLNSDRMDSSRMSSGNDYMGRASSNESEDAVVRMPGVCAIAGLFVVFVVVLVSVVVILVVTKEERDMQIEAS